MRDIAATIQPEQDELVRGDLAASVCVQGAPGTGKTAVGLHRAAYLPYTHPQRIRRGGLLILGPNRTFLSYISEVLPALGETGLRQSTVGDEIARHPVTGEDDERAAVVKHDVRMAEVLRRALYGNIGSPADALVVPDGSYRWRVPVDELRRIVDGVRAEEPPYAVGRERVRTRVVRRMQERAERRAVPCTNAWLQMISRARPVGAYVDAVWPRVRPEELVAQLLTDADVLAAAAEGLLDADEQKAILWVEPPRSWKSARWSAADLVLLDEVAGLIEHPEGYGHLVVDEAQDLSPMECRAIARRASFGSLTVLGDLAQGTTPWAAREWGEVLGHLGKPDAAVVPLTTGFRVPGAVVELANRLLGSLDVGVPPAQSLRSALTSRQGAYRFVSAASRTTSRSAVVARCQVSYVIAALLTRTSRASMSRAAAVMSASEVTSRRRGRAFGPTSRAVSAAASAGRAVTSTVWPAAAGCRATSRPMPRLAPVTRAITAALPVRPPGVSGGGSTVLPRMSDGLRARW